MLEAVRMVAVAHRRTRRWSTVLLALIVALVGGLSIALVAGARRSGSVVDRFYARSIPSDASIYDTSSVLTRRDVASLPGVREVEPFAYVAAEAVRSDGSALGFANGAAMDFAVLDPTIRLVGGHRPRASHPNEIAANRAFTDEFHVSVGDTVRLRMFGLDQADEVSNGVYEPHGPEYSFRVAAVIRLPEDVGVDEPHGIGDSAQGSTNAVAIQNRFYEAHRAEFLNYGAQYDLRYAGHVPSRNQLTAALTAITRAGADPPQIVPVEDTSHRAAIASPVSVETTALYALGIGIALAGFLVLALMIRTEQRIHDDDTPTLRALGMSARQLGGAAALRLVPVALAGSVIAVMIAVLASGQFPIGIGRQVEFDRGLHVDALVLGLGALVTFVVVLGLAFAFGLPFTTRRDHPARRSATSTWLGAVDAPVEWSLGAYLAFARGTARRSVPARPVVVGGALIVALMAGLAAYGSAVDRAYGSPSAHGWPWDAAIGNVNFALRPETARKITHDPAVVARTAANYGQVRIAGESAEVLAYDPRGSAPPEVTAGRLPERANEIALGPSTLHRLGLHLGDSVKFDVSEGEFAVDEQPGHPITTTIVGRALPPIFGESDLGNVGIVTLGAVKKSGGSPEPRFEMIDLRTGRDPQGYARLDRRYTEEIHTDFVPARIVTLHRVRSMWRVGFALLAALLVLLLGYLVAVTIRARRHDVAVVRTLGLRTRHVRGALGAESAIVSLLIVVIGIPVGLVLGRVLWRVVTESIGLHADASVVPVVVGVTLLTVVAAAVTTAIASRTVGRGPIAEPLRTQ